MCGIYGVVSLSGAPLRHPDAPRRMAAALAHRGPDATGVMRLPHAVLGANRLRIVDLRTQADQPFVDQERCVSLALNGEIYNAADLRRRFASYPFRSESDAETALPLYLARGPAGFADLQGMFAVAIWDEGSRRLVLARDRAGEKPLFYAECGDAVCFASEVQALLQHPEISRELDQHALEDFLTFGYVREPRTMFASIRKVEAGTAVVFDAAGREIAPYGATSPPEPETGSSADFEDRLATLLQAAVRGQMVADVPVGVFLSGGLDSSLIATLAVREAQGQPLHTFTVRFPDESYDEGRAARRVAEQIGSRHVEVLADDAELERAFGFVTSHVAEPIADPAILPTYLLAGKARQEVGVVLSGEGADELFGGYPAYVGHQLAGWMGRGPLAIGRRLTSLLPSSSGAVPLPFLVERFFAHAGKPWLERHVAWMGTGLGFRSSGFGVRTLNQTPDPRHPDSDILSTVMHFDYATYLRDGLLPKIDRATMLASLEARAPFLDHHLSAFALAVPAHLKVRGLTTKWLLKRAARRWLASDQIRRRKHGLSVPVSGLINGALRSSVDRLLDPGRLRRQGLLNADTAGQLLGEHRAGNFRVGRGIWAMVIFQRWVEEWT